MSTKSLGTLTIDLVAKTGSFTQGMDQAERSAKKMEREYRNIKSSIDPAFAAQERFTRASAVLKRELDRGAITLAQYNADMQRLDAATKVATAGSFRMGGAVQAAGYQIGDFAVQVASGQSALVAFTQQGSQLAGFFGPGGAVLGAVLAIGGAVAGYLVRSMGEGEKATDALVASMERLDRVTSETDGIQTLTKEIRDLAKESEVAARARIVSAMAAAEDAARSAARGIRDALDEAVDTPGLSDLSDYFDARNFGQAIDSIRSSFGLVGDEGRKAAAQIFTAMRTLDANPTVENFRALETVVSETSTSVGANSKELQGLVANLAQYFDGARTAAERTEYLKKVLTDLSAALNEEAGGAISQMVDKLKVQSETVGLTTLQMIEYNRQADLKEAKDKRATKDQIDAINAAYDRIYAHEKSVVAKKEEEEAEKKLKEVERQRYQQLQYVAALEEQVATRRNARALDVAGIGMGDRLRKEMQEVNAIQQEYARQRRRLAEAQRGPDALDDTSYRERLEALRRAEADEIQIVQESAREKERAQRDWTNGAVRALENYRDSAADIASQTDRLFTSAFSNMEDSLVNFVTTGKASFSDFANSVLSDMARIAARQAMTGLLGIGVSALGGLFSGASAGATAGDYTGADFANWVTAQAKGGAWAGGVQFFAKGGVVSSPTAFGMANGLGIMGEAGPEAIMPLARGSDGSLGVRAKLDGLARGGGVHVEVNVSGGGVDVSATDSSYQQFGADIGRFVEQRYRQLVSQDLRPGGQIWRSMNGR